MGLFRDIIFFSAEAYKIALDINENVNKIYRIIAPQGYIITIENARLVRPYVAIVNDRLNELERKTSKCTTLGLTCIKVPMPNGMEIPIAHYLQKLRNGIDLMKSDLRECLS